MPNNSNSHEVHEAEPSPQQVRDTLLRLLRMIARSIARDLSQCDSKIDEKKTGPHQRNIKSVRS